MKVRTVGTDHDAPTIVYRLLAAGSRPLVHLAFGLEVLGADNLPSGGFVLCSNHLSGFDPWALSIPLYPRQPRFMAKSEVFRRPFRTLLAEVGLFSVARAHDGTGPVDVATRHVVFGRPVLIFPAGTRRKTVLPGEVVRPRTGAARVALGAGVPLIPAAVHGTEHVRPRVRWRVQFGPPVPLGDLDALPSREAAVEATRRLWERISSLEDVVVQ
jgi:1-acyl-sn-glycerol-3-phosphate acyltransferase